MKESTRSAKKVSCPYCGAIPGYGCFYRNRQGIVRNIATHKARIFKATKVKVEEVTQKETSNG